MSSSVQLISVTPNAEETIAYCARVSSPHQDSPEYAGLLRYCIKNCHWSVFEMANMVLEINTSRSITQQILRHRSFSFQEFSQRYAQPTDFVVYEARRQDDKNRQNSIDDLDDETKQWWVETQVWAGKQAFKQYNKAIELGIAKESARMILPVSTESSLYMNGTIRSWIHYIDLRSSHGTQMEHMEIANKAKEIFVEQFPSIAEALEWTNPSDPGILKL